MPDSMPSAAATSEIAILIPDAYYIRTGQFTTRDLRAGPWFIMDRYAGGRRSAGREPH